MGRASERKATNRDIRRAFGPEALAAIRSIQDGIDDNRTAVYRERADRLELAKEQRSYVDGLERTINQRLDAFTTRGFVARLRWLFLGR